jgi:DMSO/TMAO reductase YedYZ molybdopterin-dependent catalytic subunit
VPNEPEIEIRSLNEPPFTVPVSTLATLPRREVKADFHCVAGWTAQGLRWSGVAFSDFYQAMIDPARANNTPISHISVSHIVFEGLDGFRSIVLLEDVMSTDVLLADQLEGVELNGDHGAPLRLVSPNQYGFISTKHLCRVELHDTRPPERYHHHWRTQLTLQVLKPHQRARVWQEERHRYLPGPIVRPVYHALMRRLLGDLRDSDQGGQRGDATHPGPR